MSEELKQIMDSISSNLTDLETAALVTAKVLGEARHKEYVSKRTVAIAKTAQAEAEAVAKRALFDSGEISGRNAETRKAQLDAALAEDPAIIARAATVQITEQEAMDASVSVSYYQDVFKVLIEAVRREKNAQPE